MAQKESLVLGVVESAYPRVFSVPRKWSLVWPIPRTERVRARNRRASGPSVSTPYPAARDPRKYLPHPSLSLYVRPRLPVSVSIVTSQLLSVFNVSCSIYVPTDNHLHFVPFYLYFFLFNNTSSRCKILIMYLLFFHSKQFLDRSWAKMSTCRLNYHIILKW